MALKRLKNLLYDYATKQRKKVEEYTRKKVEEFKRKVRDVRWRMAEKIIKADREKRIFIRKAIEEREKKDREILEKEKKLEFERNIRRGKKEIERKQREREEREEREREEREEREENRARTRWRHVDQLKAEKKEKREKRSRIFDFGINWEYFLSSDAPLHSLP